jgi:hypothetical protein
MEPLELYPSQLASVGQLIGSCILAAICALILLNAEEPGIIVILMLLGAGWLGLVSLQNLFARSPALVADAQGIRWSGGLLPWGALAGYEVTHGGIPLRLKIHFHLQSGPNQTIDLQELSLPPQAALSELVRRVEHYRPDLKGKG